MIVSHHHSFVFASRLFCMTCLWYTRTGIREATASTPKTMEPFISVAAANINRIKSHGLRKFLSEPVASLFQTFCSASVPETSTNRQKNNNTFYSYRTSQDSICYFYKFLQSYKFLFCNFFSLCCDKIFFFSSRAIPIWRNPSLFL